MTAAFRLAILAGALAMPLSASASAEEVYFRTPSKNIHCGYMDFDGRPSVRCDISAFTPTIGERPTDCNLDWGGAFAVAEGDPQGMMLCHGDTVISPDASTLPYGESFARGGITCTSATSGLTCENSDGHGFFLSKAKQRVY
jgi:hypothetical protein